MPLTPATSPRFGARRPANTDDFNIERDVTGPIDALDLAAKFTSSLSTARPTSPVVDQYNYSTDTNVLERWTGSAWVRPEPKPHAASHQDGGTDALTVREAMMATGALGMAKGAFRAYRNAAVSLANGGLVVFDTDTGADVSNWYDTATGRYTPQVAGSYRLSWGVTGSAVASGVTWFADLRKNTVLDTHGMPGTQAASGASVASMGTAVVQANGTTDFFDVVLGHSSGVSQALFTGSPYTFFHGHLIGRS